MRRPSPLVLAVLLGLLLVTGLAAYVTARSVDRREDQLLDERASQVGAAIDRRVDTYIEKLYGVRGFFVADGVRARHTSFNRYVDSQAFRSRLPGVLNTTFARAVTDDEQPAYLAGMRRALRESGLPYGPFRIRPGGRRPLSLVVSYVHPVRRNLEAMGLDLLAEATRRTAVTRARDTAVPAATAPIRLVQDDAPGVFIALPVYRGPSQMPRAAERAGRFAGAAIVVVRMRDVAAGVLNEDEDADLEIYDSGAIGSLIARPRAGDQSYDARGGPNAIDRDRKASRLRTVDVAGRRWTVYYQTEEQLISGSERALPWLIAILGIVVAALAAGALYFATSARRRAVALAEQMTDDLRSSRDELRRSNEELERFAFLASHDLQQPLRTVSGFLQLIDHQFRNEMPERAREYVDQALRGSRHMSTLIEDLLEYSRAGRSDRPLVPVDLDEIWDAAVAQLKTAIEECGATVEREDLPVVSADPRQMTQALTNLIANAVKYRGDAVPDVRASARALDGGWEISIRDNGIGIDPSDQERIFGMFRRLHTEDEYEGTGVGLAIVKRIIERAGGEIRVESRGRGHGSRFILHLQRGEDPR